MAVVRLAGGLLWKDGRVAVIHRPRQQDWSLPKGRVDEGEKWEEAALREVEEETGCEARLGVFAGATVYLARRTPRLALYWNLALVRQGPAPAGGEVDGLDWLEPREAAERVDHEAERRLLQRAAAPAIAPTMPSAQTALARAELLRRILSSDDAPPALGLALELLDRADALAGEDARQTVIAARRLGLLALPAEELELHATVLRARARALPPWRARAVKRLLPRDDRPAPEAVYVASQLCEETERAEAMTLWRFIAVAALAALCGAAAGAAVVLALR